MTKKQKNLSIGLATLLLFILILGHPWFYFSETINLKVVDADTKKPIDNAIVTANWQLIYSSLGGVSQGGQLQVMESVTDNQGNAYFPSWGPRFTLSGKLGYLRPQLLIYKSGYETRGLQNTTGSRITGRTTIRSDWNGKTIEMTRAKKGPKAKLKRLIRYSKEIRFFAVSHGSQCGWLKIQSALNAINSERVELEKLGYKTGVDRTIDLALIESKSNFIQKCGKAAKKVIEDMKKRTSRL